MNPNNDNTTDSENDDLDELLRALNNEPVNEVKPKSPKPIIADSQDGASDIDQLRDLFSSGSPAETTGKADDPGSRHDLDSLLSDLLVPSEPVQHHETGDVSPTETLESSLQDTDLDARLRELVSDSVSAKPEEQNDPIEQQEPANAKISADVVNIDQISQAPTVSIETPPSMPGSEQKDPAKIDADDLEDLKQFIQFDDKKSPAEDRSLIGRLNSDKPGKDPIVIMIYSILVLILLILLGFIGITVASSPAWHPTPIPSATPLLDTTENYIQGLKVGALDVPITPVAGRFEDWQPAGSEALVIESSYFCRLVYIANANQVFAEIPPKIGFTFFIDLDNGTQPIYKITEVEKSSFADFGKYSSIQRDCVAIYLDTAETVLLAEPAR